MKITLSTIVILLVAQGFSLAQSFEIYEGDTINRRDANNKRHGYWIFFGNNKQDKKSEGEYDNNRKAGVWISYYPDGKPKAEITYTLGRKKGPAKTYYKNGNVAEEGVWDANKWTGKYKAYHENGKVAYDWKYNDHGKKEGEQKYYFPDGSVMLEGAWQEGKITGKLKEYYKDGTVKAERSFVDGKVDHKQSKFFEPPRLDISAKDSAEIKYLPEGNEKDPALAVKVHSYFTGEGEHALYKDSLLSRKGFFKDGKLFNGKHYYYGEKGELLKTLVYEEGKVVKVIKAGEEEEE